MGRFTEHRFQVSLTPGDGPVSAHVFDLAGVCFTAFGSEFDTPGQMKLPALLEGQVGLVGILNLDVIPQQLDCNVWRVEVTHVADQRVVFVKLTRAVAVNLDLW